MIIEGISPEKDHDFYSPSKNLRFRPMIDPISDHLASRKRG